MSATVVIDHRKRDFGLWVEDFGEPFCQKMAEAYEMNASTLNPSTEITIWNGAKNFLNFFAVSENAKILKNYLNNKSDQGRAPTTVRTHFMLLAANYRQYLTDRDIGNRSRSNLVYGANCLLRYCANTGLIPQGLSIRSYKIKDKVGRGSTFLDVTHTGAVDVGGLMAEAESLLGTDYLDSDTVEEIKKLLTNLMPYSGEPADLDIYGAAVVTLSDRIERLTIACANDIVNHIYAYHKAQQWQQDAGLVRRAHELKAIFDAEYSGNTRQRKKQYHDLLGDDGLRVLVVFCQIFIGRYPVWSEDQYGRLLGNRISKLGLTVDEVRYYLGQSTKVLAASQAFICFRVAGNPESIRNLTVDSLSYSQDVYTLWWRKPRNGSSNDIEYAYFTYERSPGEELTVKNLSVVDVVEHITKITSSIREDADQDHKQYLFLSHFKNAGHRDGKGYVPRQLNSSTMNQHFKNICREVSCGHWESTLKSIRGSLLLLEGMVTKDATAVAVRGRHSSLSMPMKYTHHIPEMLRRGDNLREFLAWFESILTLNISDFAAKVGIDEYEYKDRVQAVLNQQFGGLHCANPRAGVQPGTKPGAVCHRVDQCVSCEMRRSLFVVSHENVVSLLQWHAVLEHACNTLPEALFQRWSLWLVFTRIMIERIKNQTEHALLFDNAEIDAKRRDNLYKNVIPTVEID